MFRFLGSRTVEEPVEGPFRCARKVVTGDAKDNVVGTMLCHVRGCKVREAWGERISEKEVEVFTSPEGECLEEKSSSS